MGRAPGAWSSGRSERLGRLRRELGRLGEGPTVGPRQAPESWPLVESFLEPSDATALGRAMLPGRARSVAGQVVEELQRRRQALVPSLVNHDRTAAVGSDVGLTVLVEGLSGQEVGCLMRSSEALGVSELLLCGDTVGPPAREVLKTSLKERGGRFGAESGSGGGASALSKGGATGNRAAAVGGGGAIGPRQPICGRQVSRPGLWRCLYVASEAPYGPFRANMRLKTRLNRCKSRCHGPFQGR